MPKLWKDWLEHEMRQGNWTEVDDIFKKCLFEVPSVELFLLYVTRVRKTNPASLGDGTPEEVGFVCVCVCVCVCVRVCGLKRESEREFSLIVWRHTDT